MDGTEAQAAQRRPWLIAAALVAGWLTVLLVLMIIELALDLGSDVGDALDTASVVVFVAGLVGVPIGTAAAFRAHGSDWVIAGFRAALALALFVLGSAAELYVYKAIEG
ncbi:MAG: hypothetical protein QM648_06205 [Solirubrobacterales bacterium]